ncbi:MAG TPA: 3-oxoacyl-ACP reductase, partial [Rhodospirillaceae bacterium]|nr:3-oxoacyl-ACP reductase [Rhodospirillaceae bacterium]
RETVRHNVTINGLLPGPFNTDRLKGTASARAQREAVSVEEAVRRIGESNPAGRVGEPEEFGQACAFLCSAGAGFITGQNLLLDGGNFPGVL